MKVSCIMGWVLGLAAGVAWAQPASWTPVAPRAGDAVTINYDAQLGTITPAPDALWLHWGVLDPETGNWSTPPEGIWPADSRLHTDHVAVQSPMTRGGDSVWSVSIDFDTTVHDVAFVFTDGQNHWDNNETRNWVLHFAPSGAVSWWAPEQPVPGDTLTIYYDAVAGTLPDNATALRLHWGVNENGHGNWQLPPEAIWPPGTVAVGVAAQTPLEALGGGLWALTLATTDSIRTLHYVVTNGTLWDNNNNRNWDILLVAPPVAPLTWHTFRFDPRSAYAGAVPGAIASVAVAGPFNGWSTTATPLLPDSAGGYAAEVRVPLGLLEYKFVINGNQWQADPDNPRLAPGGAGNSLVLIEPDSLPQVYAVQPPENRVFAAGSDVVVTVRIRPGDAGTGIALTPVARVNNIPWDAVWTAADSTLTLAPLPSAPGTVARVTVTATDSAGRVGMREVSYGFRGDGYFAVDAGHDLAYTGRAPQDLISFQAREIASGDSIEFALGVADAAFAIDTAGYLLVITSGIDGFAPLPGFAGELRLPDPAGGGVAIPLVNPVSVVYDAAHYNTIHPSGDLTQPGIAAVTFGMAENAILVHAAVADLESALGSYQTAWYYAAVAFDPVTWQTGYAREVGVAEGGVAGVEEPDIHDVLFMGARDVEARLLTNYHATRQATLDAPGRGLAAIEPEEIGPNIAAPGPVCRILTRGAPTRDATRTIIGTVQSIVAVSQAWLAQDGNRWPVTLAADTFALPVTLGEGVNRFSVWAVDANGDSGHSPEMVYTLVVDHAPDARLSARVEGGQGVLDASQSVDPELQALGFVWTADADNPAPVILQNATSAVASFVLPDVPGEYYFTVEVRDPDEHTRRGRTFITVTADSAHAFSNNEAAAWVENARIYEIFPRSYSPEGTLAAITADLARIGALGVNSIWLMPIFDGPTDHGYEIVDYYALEPDYGTEADLRNLVNAAHAQGLKVILDLVINHTGIGHPFMQDAIRHGRYSHYWDWYDRDANGNYTHYFDWTNLPNLNYANPEVGRYFIDVSKYWIEEFDIDGYRCDVAWGPMERTPQFWAQWRRELKEIKPEALLLAEASSGNYGIYLNRFDLAFDWPLHHEGAASFANMFPQIPNFTSLTNLITSNGNGWGDYKQPLRFLENHDEVRFIAENTPAQTKLAAALMLTIPGAVMLYSGQEIGVHSQRGLIPWGSDPDQIYPHYYRLMNARKQLAALSAGDFTRLPNTQANRVYSYARYGAGMAPVIFAGNFDDSLATVAMTVDLGLLTLAADSMYVVSELLTDTQQEMSGSQLVNFAATLAPFEARVWVIADSAISVDAGPPRPALPERIRLGEAYPNPFNPVTVLPLDLTARSYVTLTVYDLLGREAATLVDGVLEAGTHRVTWDGRGMGSGIYFAVLQAGSVRQVRKLVLIR